MTNTASAIATATANLKNEGINLKEVHGTNRQWAIVRSLTRLEQEETIQKLQVLATLDENSAEYIALRNTLIEGNLYFAYTIASKYATRFGTSLEDDVYQNASIGLMQAIIDYTKNGNGESFFPYAKTTISRFIKRFCITPSVKCGVKGGLNPLNKKHNAETNRKRAEKGLAPLEAVTVVGAETEQRTDDEGKSVNLFDIIPSEGLSPLEAFEEKEKQTATEKKIADTLATFDAISKKIWQMRQSGIAFEFIGKELGMKPKACQMRFYTVRDKVNEAVANYNG